MERGNYLISSPDTGPDFVGQWFVCPSPESLGGCLSPPSKSRLSSRWSPRCAQALTAFAAGGWCVHGLLATSPAPALPSCWHSVLATAPSPSDALVCSQSHGDIPDTPDSLSPSVFDEYLKTTGKPIEASIRAELSGDFEKLMLAVGTS